MSKKIYVGSDVVASTDEADIASRTINAARIPNLDASKTTTGTFNVARIPNLAATKITSGTFNAARIPNLDASKTTSGVFNIARIPNAAKAGIGTNVVSTSVTGGFSSASGTFVDVTGLAASITPTSATSKILVTVAIGCSDTSSSSTRIQSQLLRGSTAIGGGATNVMTISRPGSSGRPHPGLVMQFLDSPATTSSRTYKLQARCVNSTTFYLGQDQALVKAGMTITLIEVAA